VINAPEGVWIPRDDRGVGGELHVGDAARASPRALERAGADPGDADRPARAPRDFLGVAAEHVPRAATHGTEAQQADLQRFHRGTVDRRRRSERLPRAAARFTRSERVSPVTETEFLKQAIFAEHLLDAADRLPRTRLVLDQREAHVAVAEFAETDAG